jgi:hypothetical protein
MRKLLVTAFVAAGIAAPALPALAQTDATAPAATMHHSMPKKHKKPAHKKMAPATKAQPKAE